MEKNKEIEYKILLTSQQFQDLTKYYPQASTYTQINYYLTSPELSQKHYSFRIREKNDTYEMTLKIPEGFGKMEYNIMLTASQASQALQGQLPCNEITQLLKEKGFHLSLIKQLCSLKTIRHDIALEYGMLSLDENFYNNHHDYELEFEINDEVGGYIQFKQLLEKFSLTYTQNCKSKIKRALDTL